MGSDGGGGNCDDGGTCIPVTHQTKSPAISVTTEIAPSPTSQKLSSCKPSKGTDHDFFFLNSPGYLGMAFDPASFNSPTLDFAELPPIFRVEPVQLQFPIAADLAAVQVANNVVILALVNGLIMRIDLANPQEVDGTKFPFHSKLPSS